MSLALQMQYNLIHTSCYKCGTPMFITKDMNDRFIRTHEGFYCINGHRQSYIGERTEDKLKRQLKAETERREFAERQAEQERHRTRGQKAANTRIKNRIKNGACPCCNRTFQNLHRHMQNQHPEYAASKTG